MAVKSCGVNGLIHVSKLGRLIFAFKIACADGHTVSRSWLGRAFWLFVSVSGEFAKIFDSFDDLGESAAADFFLRVVGGLVFLGLDLVMVGAIVLNPN